MAGVAADTVCFFQRGAPQHSANIIRAIAKEREPPRFSSFANSAHMSSAPESEPFSSGGCDPSGRRLWGCPIRLDDISRGRLDNLASGPLPVAHSE